MKVADKLFLDRFRIAIVATLAAIMFLFAGKGSTVKEASATVVTFETNGGTKIDPVSIDIFNNYVAYKWWYGRDVSQQLGFWFWNKTEYGLRTTKLIEYPKKPGCVFQAWFLNKELTKYNINEGFSNFLPEFTYYAKWAPLAYTVKFKDLANGTLDTFTIANGNDNANWFMCYNSDSVLIFGRYSDANGPWGSGSYKGSEYKLPYPERSGYTFGGWCFDSTGNDNIGTASNKQIVSDTTLYASWNPLRTIIKYDTRGGSVVPSDTLEIAETSKYFGSKCVSLWHISYYDSNCSFYCYPYFVGDKENYTRRSSGNYPTREGYIFAGWCADTNANNALTDIGKRRAGEDLTLYARWVKKDIVLKYNLLGGKNSEGGTAFDNDTLHADSNYKKIFCRGWSIYYSRYCTYKHFVNSEEKSGPDILKKDNPSRSGYKFSGWCLDPGCKFVVPENTSNNLIICDTTLYAKWVKNPRIKFNSMGGTPIEYAEIDVVDNAFAEHPRINVNYCNNDSCFQINISGGNKSEIMNNPTREGYNFTGWYTDSINQENNGHAIGYVGYIVYDEPPFSLQDEITLYAGWQKSPLIVRHEMNGADPIPDDTVYAYFRNSPNRCYVGYSGSDYSYCFVNRNDLWTGSNNKAIPTWKNHIFTGWYLDSACTIKMDFKIVLIDGTSGSKPGEMGVGTFLHPERCLSYDHDNVLYAGWEQPIIICLNTMDGKKITYDTLPPMDWKTNYLPEGYYFGSNEMKSDTFPYPEAPDNNHFFNCWYTDSNYSRKYNSDLNLQDGDTLYANWSPTHYIVSYDTDGGTPIESDTLESIMFSYKWYCIRNNEGKFTYFKKFVNQQPIYQDTVYDPTKENCYFNGWYNAGDVYSDTTLKARWIKYSWLVHYNSMGGTEIADDTLFNTKDAYKWEINQTDSGYNFRSDMPLKSYPLREGYIFAGWYSDSTYKNYGGWVDAHDVTYYAKWYKQYNIVVNPMNGQANYPLAYNHILADTLTFEYNDWSSRTQLKYVGYGNSFTFDTVPYPQWEGHVFTGWFMDSLYRNMLVYDVPDISTHYICSDTVIYARWDSNSYIVKFDTRGGEEVPNMILLNDETAPDWYFIGTPEYYYFQPSQYFATFTTDTFSVPVREGYRYYGMYSDSLYTGLGKICSDTTLYVKWRKMCKISFNSMGGSPIESFYADSSAVIFSDIGVYSIHYYDKYVDSVLIEIPPPIREGFVFLGWYCDSLYTEVPYKIAKETVLYARWWDPKNPTVDVPERPHVSDRTPIIAVSNLHPNPANTEIGLSISLLREAMISISIYDASGLKVAVLMHNEVFGAGERELTFAIPAELSSGSYFIEVDSGSVSARQIRKFVIIK